MRPLSDHFRSRSKPPRPARVGSPRHRRWPSPLPALLLLAVAPAQPRPAIAAPLGSLKEAAPESHPSWLWPALHRGAALRRLPPPPAIEDEDDLDEREDLEASDRPSTILDDAGDRP